MIFYGKVQNHRLLLKNKQKWNEYLGKLSDCNVEIDIKRKRSKRTLSQNNLYWLWLTEISNYTGYYPEELHSSFKAMFLTDRSKKIPLVRSTSILNKIQFGQYLNKIEKVALELGITLPNPELYYELGWIPE